VADPGTIIGGGHPKKFSLHFLKTGFFSGMLGMSKTLKVLTFFFGLMPTFSLN